MDMFFQSNPAFPPVEKVRDEIIQTIKGMMCATMCPSLSLYLAKTEALGGISKAYCGRWGDQTFTEHAVTALLIVAASDFYEFAYHRLGHVNLTFWKQHKHHHHFSNPSPFSVIADEWVDQVRAFEKFHFSKI
jgi:lathosterol oxidase